MTDNKKDVVFTPTEFEAVSKYLMGSMVRLYPNIIVPQSGGIARIQQAAPLAHT